MKVLFVQDTYFFTHDHKQFYSEHIDNSILDRYLHLGNHVTFLGRKQVVENKDQLSKKLSPLDTSKSSIIALPNFKTIRGFFKHIRKVEKETEKAILEHDIIMPRIPSALGAIAVKYAKKHSKPLIGEVVGCTWDGYWNYSLKGKLVAPYYFLKQRRVVKKLSYAVYVTKYFLQQRYPTNGKSINCSNVVVENSGQEILNQRLEKIANTKPKDKLVIGTIAGLDVPYKGQKYVIQAISKLRGKRLLYKVVGNGTGQKLLQEAIKRKIENLLEIIGPIKHADIFDFLDGLDLYVQPSKQEGLPRALIEAMSRGIPSIGSRTGGIPELLDDKYIFEKGDSIQLMKILEDFTIEDMAREAQINFERSKEYSIHNLNNRRYKFYLEFIKEHDLPISEIMKNKLEDLH